MILPYWLADGTGILRGACPRSSLRGPHEFVSRLRAHVLYQDDVPFEAQRTKDLAYVRFWPGDTRAHRMYGML